MMRLNTRTTIPLLSVVAALSVVACGPGNPEVDAHMPQNDAFVPPVTAPELTIAPALQDFGDVTVDGSSMPTEFTVTNSGDGQSASLTASLEGAGAAQFVVTEDNCAGMRLAPMDECTISVEFSPTAEGRASARLAVTDGDVSTSASLNGNGQGEGAITISPTPVTFPTTTVGATATARTFTVRNTGASDTGSLSEMIGGADPMHFRISASTCTGMTLAAGATCTIDVEYTPMGAASHAAVLEVSGMPGGLATAAMSGVGVAPGALRIAPIMQDFGSAIIGVAGTPITFNVINGGGVATGALTTALTGASAAEFSITSDTCAGGPLAGGASCAISVRFTAASAGAKTASLDVGDGTLSVSSTLTATGVAPGMITIEPPTRDFGNSPVGVPTGATTFTVRNTGGADTGALTTAIAGANPGDFVIVSDGCAATIVPAMGSCTVAVNFTPTAAGARSASLRVVGAPGGMASSALSGMGESPAVLEVTPTSQNFGSIATGAVSTNVNFTVRNTGGSASGVPTVALIGVQATEFNIVANTCTAAIPGGGMCTVTVRFQPTTTGMKAAQLEVFATPGGRDVSDVSGIGITPAALAATPGSSPRDFNAGGAITPETMTFMAMATIINNGAETSGALATSVTGAGAGAFTISGCSGMTLAGGATCVITITFAPTMQIAYAANLVVTGMPGGTVTIPLSGNGSPDIDITASGAYPDTVVGSTADITFTVTNRTTTARTFSTRAISGAAAAQFTFNGGTCVAGTTALAAAATPGAAGGTCTIIVRFTPTGMAGARVASLDVTTTLGGAESEALNANAAGPVRFLGWDNFNGTGSPTACSAGSPGATTTFPATIGTVAAPVIVGSSGANTRNARLCVQNTSGAAAGVISTAMMLPADMLVTFDSCNGVNLAGGAYCTIAVRYFPPSAGTTNGTVNLSYGANSTAASVVGNAASAAALTITNADFGTTVAGNTTTRMIRISNPGTVDAVNVSNSLTGAAGGATWTITANTCTVTAGVYTVPAGMFCDLTLTFTPTTNATSPNTRTLNIFRTGFTTVTATVSGLTSTNISITGASTDFTTPVGTPLTRSYTITNLSAVSIASISCNVAGAGFSRNNLCTGALAAGGTCTCDVTFNRAVAGSVAGSVTAQSTAGTFGTVSLALTGNAQSQPALSHEPATSAGSPQQYGSVRNGTNGSSFRFTIRNTGTLTSAAITTSIGGTNPGDFDITSNTCTTLTGGSTCTIDIRFSPTTTGGRSASILVSAGATSTTIFVTGTGQGNTVVSVSPNIQDYGSLPVGTPSAGVTVTVTNNDVSTRSAAVGAPPAGYAVSANTCTATLAAGTNCSFVVTFTPTAAAAFNGAITVGPTASHQVRGNGLAAAAITLTAGASTAYGSIPVGTSSAAVTFTVQNTGGVSAPAINAVAIGVNPAHYTATNTCNGVVLTANDGVAGVGTDQCQFTIAFSPALVGGYGSKPGTIQVTAGSGAGMISSGSIALSGTGVNPAALGISPGAGVSCLPGNAFARASAATSCSAASTWTLSNTGDVQATGIAYAFSNTEFTTGGTGSTCGTTLNAGASCSIVALYNPLTVGADSGVTLTVTSTNGGMVTGSISGNAVTAVRHTNTTGGGGPAHTAGTVAFANTPVAGGGAANDRQVTIQNGDGVTSVLGTGTLRYAISGTNAADFDVVGSDTCTGQALGNAAFCALNVDFVPTAAGARTATLTIDDGTAERRIVITLNGTGT